MKYLLFEFFILINILFLLGCNNYSKTKIIEDLKSAYKLEVTSKAKYEAYAEQSKKDGYERLSVLLVAASKSASICAENYKSEIKKLGLTIEEVKPEFDVKNTRENLLNAIDGINKRVAEFYPKVMKRGAKHSDAKKLYTWARKTEEKQAQYFSAALQAVETNMTNSFYTLFFVCPNCGYIIMPQELENECGLCKVPKDKLIPIG